MAEYNRKDHLYKKAKSAGYRSRAAYKLLELDRKFKLLRPGMTVLDLGCYPGGWLQVALERTRPSGQVLGVDLRDVEETARNGRSAKILKGDASQTEVQAEIRALCGGKVDIVLSDMSHQLTGIRLRDACLSAELVQLALSVAKELLRENGSLVAKIFPGQECEELAQYYRAAFRKFSRQVLQSSRKSSKEIYFVGCGFIRQDDAPVLEEEKADVEYLRNDSRSGWDPKD